MSKALQSLIFLISILCTISVDEKFLNLEPNYRPFVSVPNVESLKKIVNQMEVSTPVNPTIFAENEENRKNEGIISGQQTVRCYYLNEFNVYDISGLCAKESNENKEVARKWTLKNPDDNKDYTIYVNFCRNLKKGDKCNQEEKSAQAYYEVDGKCDILAGDIGSGNTWTTVNINGTQDLDYLSITVNKEGKHNLIYNLKCDPDLDDKDPNYNFRYDKSYVKTNIENGLDVVLYIEAFDACVKLDFYFIWKFIDDYKAIFIIALMAFGLFNMIFGMKLARINSFILCVVIVTILVLVFSQYVLPSGCKEWIIWVMLFVGILLGGTAGYFVFKYHEKVMALIAGGISGFFIGQFLYNLFGNKIEMNGLVLNIIFDVVAIAVMVIVAYCFNKFIIIFATSFIGSYIFVRGISLFAGGFPSEIEIMDLNREGETKQLEEILTWEVYVYMAAIAVGTVLSTILQFKFNKDTDGDEDNSDSKDKNLMKSAE